MVATNGSDQHASARLLRREMRGRPAIGKKKPEIKRSRAKSTKGGGWRRQPWHVGPLTLLAGRVDLFCSLFQHPIIEVHPSLLCNARKTSILIGKRCFAGSAL